MGEMESPYDVLNVAYGASESDIKNAYRRESRNIIQINVKCLVNNVKIK